MYGNKSSHRIKSTIKKEIPETSMYYFDQLRISAITSKFFLLLASKTIIIEINRDV